MGGCSMSESKNIDPNARIALAHIADHPALDGLDYPCGVRVWIPWLYDADLVSTSGVDCAVRLTEKGTRVLREIA